MGVSFIQKGKAAQQAIAREEANAKRIEEERKNKVFRFRLPEETDGAITFLDGDLDDDGLLEVNQFWEHTMLLNGSWDNHFVCVEAEEPCPICEGGSKPTLVGAFTVIDHSEWVDRKGETHKDERKLLVAKRQTLKLLQKIATKRDGLTGCTFEVTRTGDKSASVGNQFDFYTKNTVNALKKRYGDDADPIDYEAVIQYRTAKALRELGFGAEKHDPYDDEDTPPPKKPAKKPSMDLPPPPKKSGKTYEEPEEEESDVPDFPPPKKTTVKPKPSVGKTTVKTYGKKAPVSEEEYDEDM